MTGEEDENKMRSVRGGGRHRKSLLQHAWPLKTNPGCTHKVTTGRRLMECVKLTLEGNTNNEWYYIEC